MSISNLIKIILISIIAVQWLNAQPTTPAVIPYGSVDPGGTTCPITFMASTTVGSGKLYYCNPSTVVWTLVTSGGGGGLTGSGTANDVAKWTGAAALGNSSIVDDGTNATQVPKGVTVMTTGGYDLQLPNNASTGTSLNKMACQDGAGLAVVCPTSNPGAVIGVCIQNCGTTGNAQICTGGRCLATFDNTSVVNDWAILSVTVAGDLHDTGSTSETVGQQNVLIDGVNSGTGTTALVRFGGLDAFTAAGKNSNLPKNAVVIGTNSGGVAQSQTVSGNTQTVPTYAGAFINGNFVSSDSNHNLIDSGVKAAGNYSQSFSSVPSVVLTHNLGTTNVIVACYDSASPPNFIIPSGVAITDSNDVTVTFSSSQSGKCVVSGMGGTGAGGGTANQTVRQLGAFFDGGGSALTAQTNCTVMDFAATITGATLIADFSGSATVDVQTVAYASFTGPASASSITASATPALSTAIKYQDTTLTGWTTALTANTVVCFKLTAPSTVTKLNVDLKMSAN